LREPGSDLAADAAPAPGHQSMRGARQSGHR
jgi:hypothetical protein